MSTSFESVHAADIEGKLEMFDRMIFHGHLTSFFREGAFAVFLWACGVLLKDFAPFVNRATAEVKAHAEAVAAKANRPFKYLADASTKRSGHSKEDQARAIAEQHGVREGLVCVFSVLEPCWSFDVRGNRETCRKEVVRRQRKCLHFYFYYIDREFGWMHVRLQSWFPFQVQVYINGREWLARQMDKRGIAYRRYENCFTHIADLPAAQRLCERFRHRRWHHVLQRFARAVNPWMPRIKAEGFGDYYWVLDQCEVATDIMFRSRAALTHLLPQWVDHALRNFSARDVLRFLGRKLHGNFKGEATTDGKQRPEGYRVKHRVKENSIKFYDKDSVLRVETTINNPREFKVLRADPTRRPGSRRWSPLPKGVDFAWRHFEVGTQANARYLEALAQVASQREAVSALDGLCRSATRQGRHVARLNPATHATCALFAAALAGEHSITGFRNHDLCARLYARPPASAAEAKRRCARVSRLIAQLRGHRLVAKVRASRLYRPTPYGIRVMAAALHARNVAFPEGFRLAS